MAGRLEKGGAGLLIEGSLGGRSIGCLVDTGATVNMLSLSWWRSHGEPGTLETTKEVVYSVEGRPLRLHGSLTIALIVGRSAWPMTFELSEIPTDAIVGCRFLRESGFMVDLAGERLLRRTWVEEEEMEEGLNFCRVISCNTMVIPPGEERLIDGYLVGDWEGEDDGLVEGLREMEEHRGLLVGRALIDTRESNTPVRIFNPGQDPVVVYRDMTLASLEPVGTAEPPGGHPGGVGEKCRLATDTPPGTEEEVRAVLEVLTEGVKEDQIGDLSALLRKHIGPFQLRPGDTGRANSIQHHIRTGNRAPIRLPPRRLAPHRRALVDAEVDKMLETGIIEEAEGPWASPVVLVKKKDGSMRFCVDYRKLNEATVKDAYPLPRIDDSLDTLAGSQWFSTMDLVSGYWQVAMAPEDREKTAFSTHRGLFQFTVMPFGLCNAPGTFERLMEVAMRGLQWTSCLVYLDDIVVFSRDFQGHLRRLGEVLERLESAGLKVKPKKCQLAQKEVAFLGHVVSERGIATDPAKIEAIRDWPTPCSLTEVRSFVGLAGYYRSFVPDFASLAKPLTSLAEKGRVFRWGEQCQAAFTGLQELLMSAPILGYPEEEGQLVLDTDASDTGLGAVLSQRQGGKEIVLSYGSRTLNRAERNYCVTRRELLGVVFGLKKFRHYLLGRNVLVRTDHAALKWVMAFKEPEGQVARWLQIMDTYDFTIEHRPGRLHGNADGLSRIPCRQCGRSDGEEGEVPAAVRMITRAGSADPEVAEGIRQGWTKDQREDPVVGRVYQWVQDQTTPPPRRNWQTGHTPSSHWPAKWDGYRSRRSYWEGGGLYREAAEFSR